MQVLVPLKKEFVGVILINLSLLETIFRSVSLCGHNCDTFERGTQFFKYHLFKEEDIFHSI